MEEISNPEVMKLLGTLSINGIGEIHETEEDENNDNNIILVFNKLWLKSAFTALDDDLLGPKG